MDKIKKEESSDFNKGMFVGTCIMTLMWLKNTNDSGFNDTYTELLSGKERIGEFRLR